MKLSDLVRLAAEFVDQFAIFPASDKPKRIAQDWRKAFADYGLDPTLEEVREALNELVSEGKRDMPDGVFLARLILRKQPERSFEVPDLAYAYLRKHLDGLSLPPNIDNALQTWLDKATNQDLAQFRSALAQTYWNLILEAHYRWEEQIRAGEDPEELIRWAEKQKPEWADQLRREYDLFRERQQIIHQLGKGDEAMWEYFSRHKPRVGVFALSPPQTKSPRQPEREEWWQR